MRNYTQLGEGKTVKVLAVYDNGYSPARTVVTCSAEMARDVARLLVKTDRELPAALHQVAVAANLQPVQARRHLLGTFDRVADGGAAEGSLEDPWGPAERLVSRLADCVTGEPAAVKAAVRAELASHLDGFDGVLVPARAEGTAYRGGVLDLVVSGALDAMGDDWWAYLLGPHGDLGAMPPHPNSPDGPNTVESTELYYLIDHLWDAEPDDGDFRSTAMRDLEGCDDGHDAVLHITAEAFQAWVNHHRPADAARVAQMLT